MHIIKIWLLLVDLRNMPVVQPLNAYKKDIFKIKWLLTIEEKTPTAPAKVHFFSAVLSRSKMKVNKYCAQFSPPDGIK